MRHTRIIVTHYGGPDALRVVEEACPEPKNGEVRVRVLAARELVPVPSGLDAAEAVSLVLNYITAYQMLHRASLRPA